MARQPEVFVRELDPAEAQRLVKITRTARDRVRLRRAGIVLASMQGRSPAEAAAMFAATAQYAREVIHAFNDQGFAALDPKWSGGRPRKFGSVAREIVCRVAKTAPQQLGLPFTTWSLTKLVEHLARAHRIVVSTETVRQVLREASISWQATKTWKGSRDPERPWSLGSMAWSCSAARPARPPLPRTSSMLMRPGNGGVHRHVPGDQALRVRAACSLVSVWAQVPSRCQVRNRQQQLSQGDRIPDPRLWMPPVTPSEATAEVRSPRPRHERRMAARPGPRMSRSSAAEDLDVTTAPLHALPAAKRRRVDHHRVAASLGGHRRARGGVLRVAARPPGRRSAGSVPRGWTAGVGRDGGLSGTSDHQGSIPGNSGDRSARSHRAAVPASVRGHLLS